MFYVVYSSILLPCWYSWGACGSLSEGNTLAMNKYLTPHTQTIPLNESNLMMQVKKKRNEVLTQEVEKNVKSWFLLIEKNLLNRTYGSSVFPLT